MTHIQLNGKKDCSICQRLGKNECGYHKFRNECLNKLSKSQIKEHQVNNTQTSNNARSSFIGQLTGNQPLQREEGYRSNVNIHYQQPRNIQEGQLVRHEEWRGPESREMHYQSGLSHSYQQSPPPMPMQNHIMRVQGDQVLYYPIYPVYEVVYEPVSNNSSFISQPSSRIVHN